MRRPSIIGVALAAGIFAFVWTLHTKAPPLERRQSQLGSPFRRAQIQPAGPLGQQMILGMPVTLEQLRQHAEENQESWLAWLQYAQRLTWAGRMESMNAWQQVVKISELEDRRSRAAVHYAAGVAHQTLGEEDLARRSFEESRRLYLEHLDGRGLPYRDSWYRLARASAAVGDDQGARRALLRASELAAEEAGSPVAHFALAIYSALLGEQERSMTAFIESARLGFADAVQAEHDPDLALLREHPKFFEVLLRIRGNADAWNRRRYY